MENQTFAQKVAERLKGDDVVTLSEAIAKKSKSALTGQIAALESKLVDDEDALAEAQEALSVAKYPTVKFKDNKAYCAGILAAQNAVDAAEQVVESTEDSISYWKQLLQDEFTA